MNAGGYIKSLPRPRTHTKPVKLLLDMTISILANGAGTPELQNRTTRWNLPSEAHLLPVRRKCSDNLLGRAHAAEIGAVRRRKITHMGCLAGKEQPAVIGAGENCAGLGLAGQSVAVSATNGRAAGPVGGDKWAYTAAHIGTE